MNRLIVQLRILARAEMTLIKSHADRRTNQTMLAAISIGCIFVALVFVNVGMFFELTESDTQSRAAFILAGLNLALAIIPAVLRRQSKPGPEEKMVREIREMAVAEISRDIASITDDFSALGSGIKQLKSGISSIGGSRANAIGAFAPMLPLLIDLLKKNKK